MADEIQVNIEQDDINIDIQGAIVNYTAQPLNAIHELITLDSGHISAKAVNLQHTPDGNVELIILSANPQVETIDWQIIGSSISWNGLDIDGILETGDILSIKYYYS